MATYVKVDLPKDMEGMAELMKEIMTKHEQLRQESPLVLRVREKAEANWEKLKPIVEEMLDLRKRLFTLKQKRDNIMGTGKAANTADTTKSVLRSIRDTLLGAYKGEERELVNWGLKVSITEVPGSRFLAKPKFEDSDEMPDPTGLDPGEGEEPYVDDGEG